jgi:hypothetical protein
MSRVSTGSARTVAFQHSHTPKDATEAAYWRDDALEKRRPMMVAWSRFCIPANAAKVIPFAGRRDASRIARWLRPDRAASPQGRSRATPAYLDGCLRFPHTARRARGRVHSLAIGRQLIGKPRNSCKYGRTTSSGLSTPKPTV